MIKNLTLGNMPNRMPLMLGLLLGLISAALIVVYLGQANSDGGSKGGQVTGDTTAAVVASQDIPAGTKITADMVSVKQIPISVVLQGSIQELTGVVDQVTSVPIVAGEQVLTSKVSATGIELSQFAGDLPLSVVLPAGRRAFSVAVSEVSAAGGLIKPGYYVDVIQSSEEVSAADSSKTVGTSCYVAQDVQVLAVAQQLVATAGQTESAQEIAAAGTETGAISATLAVTPQEASALAAAQRSVDGTNVQQQVWLSVRPFGEHGVNGDLAGCQ